MQDTPRFCMRTAALPAAFAAAAAFHAISIPQDGAGGGNIPLKREKFARTSAQGRG